jgi:hypothetical protein
MQAQRGVSLADAELIILVGTEVSDGYLVRRQDYQRVERELKGFLDRVRRLQGKRLVSANGRIVTVYHASPRRERRLLRNAYECDLTE